MWGWGVNFGTNLGDITCEWSLTVKRTAAIDGDADTDRKLSIDDMLKFSAKIVGNDLYSALKNKIFYSFIHVTTNSTC